MAISVSIMTRGYKISDPWNASSTELLPVLNKMHVFSTKLVLFFLLCVRVNNGLAISANK